MITASHPFIKVSQEIAELCSPLMLFDIHHFTYLKHFDDGSRVGLSNKPQWIEDYYNLGLYQTSLFEAKPSLYQAKSDIWIGDYDLDVYRHGKQYYNTSHSITVTEPQKDACEFFLFATTPDNYQAINFLASNMDIIYHFIAYFKDRAYFLLKKIENKKLILEPTCQEKKAVIITANDEKYKALLNRKKQFYQNTPIYKYIFEANDLAGIKLTQRELDCIAHLLNNRTSTEMAKLMNISRRTAETYMENIRNKLNCNSKADLYAKIVNNKFINAIRY